MQYHNAEKQGENTMMPQTVTRTPAQGFAFSSRQGDPGGGSASKRKPAAKSSPKKAAKKPAKKK
jgi:hypothetical protein